MAASLGDSSKFFKDLRDYDHLRTGTIVADFLNLP